LSDERSFSLRIGLRENLAFFAALHSLERRAALARVDELLARVGLAAQARTPYRALSTGMRQRAAVARGLLGGAQVLLFDEPTRGIDPAGAASLWRLIAEASRGRTVIVATHNPDEARALCGRVLVLAEGRARFFGAPDEAVRRLAPPPAEALVG
jgi:ABC-2 type transport system ATP-binding protein